VCIQRTRPAHFAVELASRQSCRISSGVGRDLFQGGFAVEVLAAGNEPDLDRGEVFHGNDFLPCAPVTRKSRYAVFDQKTPAEIAADYNVNRVKQNLREFRNVFQALTADEKAEAMQCMLKQITV